MMETDMNKSLVALALSFGLVGFAARAQTAVSDTDGNGTFSIEELSAAYPNMNAAQFAQVDVDGNGSVDADELQAARENGVLAN